MNASRARHRPAEIVTTILAAAVLIGGCDAAPGAAEGAPAQAAAEAEASAWSAPRVAGELAAALGRGGRHELASVAVDSAGVLHAVFAADADGDGHADALRYARLSGGRWSAPETVVTSMSLAEAAQVAVDGDGAVHVLWYGHSGTASARDVPTELVQRVRAGGVWSAPRVLYRETSRWGMNVRWLAAAADARGDVRVVYAPQGRGFGTMSVRGEHAGRAEYLDHDGNMMAFSDGPAGAPLELAYIGETVSKERPAAVNDVFVRPLRGGAWGPRTEAWYGPNRYSHYPRLVTDGRGVRHLFWLEDTDGSVQPEALFYATSADGKTWSAPRDLTPPGLRGGVLFRVSAMEGDDGAFHLLLRHSRADGSGLALSALTVRDGRVSVVRTLVAPGELWPGETHLVHDAAGHRVIALWRGADGLYRSSTLDSMR